MQQKTTELATVNRNTGLTPLQEKAATLLAGGMTITEVAGAVSIDRTTIYRWLSIVTFQCYLNRQAADNKESLRNGLFSLTNEALAAIRQSLQSSNEATRLKAAIWLIERVESATVGYTDPRAALKDEQTKETFGDWGGPKLDTAGYRKRLTELGLDE